ncbi:autophagy-related protein 9A-like [Pecten maximus]|uniref:autophagy-related protein 9A-like n=1 Tax=Pecten maximus TaxID=6579 RepID=UPI00145877D7|nr:autophagy-related protein 9A-like [Pecten maximus]
MAEYETQYQSLASYDEEEETDDNEIPVHDTNFMIHVVPESSRWNHIENLDDFFARVYNFHQRGGYVCMVVEDLLQLIQFLFVVWFSTFLASCVRYDVLFANEPNMTNHKVTIPEAIRPFDQCLGQFDFGIVLSLLVALVFWMFRLIKVIYNIVKYTEIRSFYIHALNISAAELPNMTWHEVQRCLLEVQKEQQMCIHKQELTELDLYHRILRFKNYMVAMVNKSLLPVKFKVPFLGDYAFLSTGLKYNLELILFWGPWSPFENNWKLKEDFRQSHRRKHLAEMLSKRILWIGIANLVLSPLIFLWQILYSFFRYAELIKRQPGILGARRWSNYSRLYLRHFNELDHEYNARLNRGYPAANMYMNIFTSRITIIMAKNVAFFAGSILAVLVVLSVYDEDVLSVEHVLTTISLAGLVVTACRVLIPDEHMVYCPEVLMRNILSHIHYIPDYWKGNAHTYKVRDEFAILFQYKLSYLIEELLSPLVTPFILCLSLRYKSLEIVDFFRNFTVTVVGVGDVCSFAQMDVRKHGHPEWAHKVDTEANQYNQAEDGKTELSLMHFHLTNPEWKPPNTGGTFIQTVQEEAQKEMSSLGTAQSEMPGVIPGMFNSHLPSLGLLPSTLNQGMGYNSLASSVAMQSTLYSPTTASAAPTGASGGHGIHHRLKGGISQIEGPLGGGNLGLLSSMTSSGSLHGSGIGMVPHSNQPRVDEGTLEMMSHDMSFSALYLHDLQFKRSRGQSSGENIDIRTRATWQRQDSNQSHVPMAHIQEAGQEDNCEELLSHPSNAAEENEQSISHLSSQAQGDDYHPLE